jgi:hypothetical protein
VAPIVLRLFMALLATVFGLYFVGALVRGKASLPQRFGPSIVVDRRTKPGSFWTAVVVAGVVTSFAAVVAILGPMKPPAGNELAGIDGGCLSVRDGLTSDGTPVELRPCIGGPSAAFQYWTAPDGKLVATGSDKCLEVKGGSSADGAAIDIATCSGAPNQRWEIQAAQIVGIGGKCLDAQDGDAEVKAVRLEPCDGQPNQAWRDRQPY